jgi:hypothetical protein
LQLRHEGAGSRIPRAGAGGDRAYQVKIAPPIDALSAAQAALNGMFDLDRVQGRRLATSDKAKTRTKTSMVVIVI